MEKNRKRRQIWINYRSWSFINVGFINQINEKSEAAMYLQTEAVGNLRNELIV